MPALRVSHPIRLRWPSSGNRSRRKAVSETEVAIDAVVAVRDRVIQAYEDIMKMPI